ncbi:MAG: UDP-N-acetylmuramoyl-tripeptide--D-alanyl-D-alanine ligase [Chlamydiota bacterium]|nr:UDP-N-acetylmuramoyl-tripeptide--D-alanyl-D-alanine ligase [Chlamydiota bacterium]
MIKSICQIPSIIGSKSQVESRDLVNQYAVDSRNVTPGSLFIALPGERVDGHSYIEQAKDNGAIAAVVALNYTGDNFGLPLIRVKDPQQALHTLAQKLVKDLQAKIIGITGSVGKTTTKNFLATLLSKKFKLMVTPGNQNSQIGMPLAILNNVTGEEEVLILEMGMSKPGNITRLVNIAPPDISVITSVELAHAANFSSLNEIAVAKGEIFQHPHTSLGIMPNDINESLTLVEMGDCRKERYSLDSKLGRKLTKDSRQLFSQAHVQKNLLAALTVALALGCQYEELAQNFHLLELPLKRQTKIVKNGVIFIDDSYNACTASVKEAIHSMPPPVEGRKKIAVLGEMLELGKFSRDCHAEVGLFAKDRVDAMYCLGNECEHILNQWNTADKLGLLFHDQGELIEALRNNIEPGDVVLVKGSSAKKMWQVIEKV